MENQEFTNLQEIVDQQAMFLSQLHLALLLEKS